MFNGVDCVLKQYTLSTGFDLSSTITGPVSVNLTDTDDDVFGLDFNNDGTKVFIAGNENDSIYSFTLSTGFDLSTFDVSSKVTLDVGPSPGPGYDHEPFGIEFSPDGTRMFVVGTADNGVDEYTLSTGFDISTATHECFLSVFSDEVNPSGIAFNTTGTKMFLLVIIMTN